MSCNSDAAKFVIIKTSKTFFTVMCYGIFFFFYRQLKEKELDAALGDLSEGKLSNWLLVMTEIRRTRRPVALPPPPPPTFFRTGSEEQLAVFLGQTVTHFETF